MPTDLSSFLERAGHFNREESEFLSDLRNFYGYVLAKNVAPTVLVSMISSFGLHQMIYVGLKFATIVIFLSFSVPSC